MKTTDAMLSDIATMIAHMHSRTAAYVGDLSRMGAAETLDGMFWTAHWIWASIQDRSLELQNLMADVGIKHDCGCLGFPGGYRHRFPESEERSVVGFVAACWAEIDERLGIDISEAPA